MLKNEKAEILDQFVQDFMKNKMDNDRIAECFEKYFDIDKAGIFYPVLIQELTFLGEKVFGKKRDTEKIHEEVRDLIQYLHCYAQRKLKEDIIADFYGAYCKFAIRIIGKRYKINHLGEETYKKNLCKINKDNETIYLIGNADYKPFMKSVFDISKDEIQCSLLTDESYTAVIKDEEGKDFKVKSYMMILRNSNIKVYHKQ